MNSPHIIDHDGIKIYVLNHWRLWQYFFHYHNEIYMQFTTHNPPWWRWLVAPFGYPLYDKDDKLEVQDTLVGHARRSIDHLIDPESEHCPHDVKIKGKQASKCAVCAKIPPIEMDDEEALGKILE